MNLELVTTILTASLLGSTHCAGMCGPFVLLFAGQPSNGQRGVGIRITFYHLGRLITYLFLGALAGGLGYSLNSSGWLPGSQRGAAYLAAATMFLSALVLVLRQAGVPLQHLPVPQRWTKGIYAGFRWAKAWPEIVRALWVGLLTTWIPCGWLYAFVIVAAGSGHILAGMVIMMSFWLGTVPMLSLIGASAGHISQRWRLATPWIAIASSLILGWMTLQHRTFDLSALGLPQPVSAETIPHLSSTKLPCCHDD